jgi:hypothetical protein
LSAADARTFPRKAMGRIPLRKAFSVQADITVIILSPAEIMA